MEIVINKRGTHLYIKDGCYAVKNIDGILSIPIHTIKSIVMHNATSVTYEAIATALKFHIDLIFIGRDGFPIGRLWDSKFGTIATVRKNQPSYANSEQGKLKAINWIIEKLNNQILILQALDSWSAHILTRLINASINNLMKAITQIRTALLTSEWKSSIRGIEGQCSMQYFACISGALPPSFSFERRSQHPAKDMYNAMLNYAYGMLYKEVETVLIKTGIDPAIGIFHADEYNRPVLAYDFIEPYRYWADYVVINLCMQQAVFEDFFDVNHGIYWCGDGAKRILSQAMIDYLEEIINLNGKLRTRRHHLFLAAQSFAQELKMFQVENNDSPI